MEFGSGAMADTISQEAVYAGRQQFMGQGVIF